MEKTMKIVPTFLDISSTWSTIGQFAAGLLSAFFTFFSQYVFGDATFAIQLSLLVFFDLMLGIGVSVKLKRFNWEVLFKHLVTKVVVYFIFMSCFWIMTQIETNTGNNPLFWFDWVGYSVLSGREIVSIFKNGELLRPGTFPEWFIKNINLFDKIEK